MESAFSKTSGFDSQRVNGGVWFQLHAVTGLFLVKVSRAVNKKLGFTD